MLKVLFVMEQYCDSKPECGITNSEHLVIGSLLSTGFVALQETFYFDTLDQHYGKEKMQQMLLDTCQNFWPDLIVFTPLGGLMGEGHNPTAETLLKIRDGLGQKIFMISWDAKPGCRLEVERLPYVSCVGVNGSVAAFDCYRSFPQTVFFMGSVDPATYYDMKLERDIDVSFIGTLDSPDHGFPLRKEYMEFLQGKGLNIFVDGGQRVHRLEVEECRKILSRSKIGLNFCQDKDHRHNLKSRVFETMACGALLLDEWGTDANYLYRAWVDFGMFGSKEDLYSKIQTLLAQPERLKAIALAGQEKTLKTYSARNEWAFVLEKMGFELPEAFKTDTDYLYYKEIMRRL